MLDALPTSIVITLDERLEGMLAATPAVVSYDPEDATIHALINDCASRLNRYDTIAARYGLSMQQLHDFIAQPEVRKRVKSRRAIWESDDSVAERNRRYYGSISLEAAPVLDRMLHDPLVPPGTKLEAFKIAGKFGGLEVNPSKAQIETGQTSAQFNVQIVFSGGAVERISTVTAPPVLEGEAA